MAGTKTIKLVAGGWRLYGGASGIGRAHAMPAGLGRHSGARATRSQFGTVRFRRAKLRRAVQERFQRDVQFFTFNNNWPECLIDIWPRQAVPMTKQSRIYHLSGNGVDLIEALDPPYLGHELIDQPEIACCDGDDGGGGFPIGKCVAPNRAAPSLPLFDNEAVSSWLRERKACAKPTREQSWG